MVENAPKSGRPSVYDTKINVLLTFKEYPHTYIRKYSRYLDVTRTLVHKLVKLKKWRPFIIKHVQELKDDDTDRRLEFCETINNYHRELLLIQNIFSYEATFTLNGEKNHQNCRYWAKENPKWMREHHTKYPKKSKK